MDCGTAGLPVHHQLPEFTQTHVHWVGDAVQPSHPLSSPFPPAFNLSQHQGLFQWVSSSHQLAKVLEFQFQHQSFRWLFRTDFLKDGLVGSVCSPRDSLESSPIPQFKSINSQPSLPTPLFFCQENPRDRGAWSAAIYGVTQNRTQLKWLSSGSSSFLYSPTFTSINDYWKNHGFDLDGPLLAK